MIAALSKFRLATMDLEGWVARVRSAWDRLTPAARLRIFIYVVFALQIAKVSRLVPVNEIFDGSPLTEFHFGQIYSDVLNDREFTRISQRPWGYDPFIGAGQPVGSGLAPESQAPIVFDRLFRPHLLPAVTIKIFFWLAFLSGPFILVAAARLFGFDYTASAIALALACAGSLSFEFLTRALIFRGNISLWVGAHLALFNAAALYAFLMRDSRRSAVAFALTLPVLPLLDPAMAILQLVPIGIMLVDAPAPARRRSFGWIAMGAALTLMLNAFWIRPFLIFHRFSNGELGWPTPGIRGLYNAFLPMGKNSLNMVFAALRAYIVVFGVAELLFNITERRLLARALLTWGGVLFLVGFFGGHVSWFRNFEPGRLGFLFMLVMSLPASAFMAATFLKPGSVRKVLFLWALWLAMSWQTVSMYDALPIRSSFTVRERRLLPDLRHLPRDRRILVEYIPEINDMLRMAARLTDRSFVGFNATWWNTSFGRSTALDVHNGVATLFGRPLTLYEAPTLMDALDRYNVGIIIATTKATRIFFDDFPGIVKPYRAHLEGDEYWIYEVVSPGTGYFIEGSGRVWFDRNRIRVRPDKPGPMTLSLHWLKGMTARPPVEVRSKYLEDDPVPFISIDNSAGAKDIEIFYEPR